jgi:putative protease
VPLCRTPEQLEAVIAAGFKEVELDWMEFVGLRQAVERARAFGLRVVIATVRVQKPGEEGYDRRIASLAPDGVLVRHWGALTHFARLARARAAEGGAIPTLHGDFSLNLTNSLSARYALSCGLSTFTASHDLDSAQLSALLAAVPARRAAVTIHHHIPTFHTEHCVYAHLLSEGRDFRTCGRPCEAHKVALRDHKGLEHPVLVDVECRNTVFNASAQSAAGLSASLVARGVGRLRVECVWETRAQVSRVLEGYQGLLSGALSPQQALKEIGAHEQFGLTTGTMQVYRGRL